MNRKEITNEDLLEIINALGILIVTLMILGKYVIV